MQEMSKRHLDIVGHFWCEDMSSQVGETHGGFPDGRWNRPTQHWDPADL